MDKVILVLGIALTVVLAPILGVLFGALAGLSVGLVFPDTVARAWAVVSDTPAEPWQVGAAFGFIAGFFRTVQAKSQ